MLHFFVQIPNWLEENEKLHLQSSEVSLNQTEAPGQENKYNIQVKPDRLS